MRMDDNKSDKMKLAPSLSLRRFVVFGVLLLVFFPTWGCSRLLHKVQESRRAADGQLQATRSLVLAEKSFQSLDRADLALSVSSKVLNQLVPTIQDALNSDPELQKQNISASKLSLTLGQQQITVQATIHAPYKGIKISATADITGVVAGVDGGIGVNVYARGLVIKDVSRSSKISDDDAVKLANEFLDATLPLINIALDRKVNRTKQAILVAINQKYLINQDVQSLNNDSLKFASRAVQVGLSVPASAVVVTPERLSLIAKVNFVSPDQVTPATQVIPRNEDLLEISKAEADRRINAFQVAVESRMKGLLGNDLPIGSSDKIEMALTLEAASRLINFSFAQGPFAGTAEISANDHTDVSLSAVPTSQNCGNVTDACTYQDQCANPAGCEHSVTQQVPDAACLASCATVPNVDTHVPGVGNPHTKCVDACGTVLKPATQLLDTPLCNAYRAANNASGGAMCRLASNISKADCDTLATLSKSLCDVMAEVGRHPIANVHVDSTIGADLTASINTASTTADLGALNINATISGSGNAAADISYVRGWQDLAIPGLSLGVCVADWKDHVATHFSAVAQTFDLAFSGAISADNSGVKIQYSLQGDPVVFLNFSPTPIDALFGDHPYLALNCPSVVIGSTLMGAYEGLFQQADARQVLPLLNGHNFPYHAKGQQFSFVIPNQTICVENSGAKCARSIQVSPKISGGTLVYLSQ
jgi:hypothetical protein